MDLVSLLCYNKVFQSSPAARLVCKRCRDESDFHTECAHLRLDPNDLDGVRSQARLHARFGSLTRLKVSIRPLTGSNYTDVMEALTQYMRHAGKSLARVTCLEMGGDAGLVSWLAPWFMARLPCCTSVAFSLQPSKRTCDCCRPQEDGEEEREHWPCGAGHDSPSMRSLHDHWVSLLDGMLTQVPQEARGRVTSVLSNLSLDATGFSALQSAFRGVRELTVGALHASLATARTQAGLTSAAHIQRINLLDGMPCHLTSVSKRMCTLFPNLKCVGSTRSGTDACITI